MVYIHYIMEARKVGVLKDLENPDHRQSGGGGSIPSASAWQFRGASSALTKTSSHGDCRLAVKTPGCEPGNSGANPDGLPTAASSVGRALGS